MDTIHQKAEAFTLSYKKAMELSLDDKSTLPACADALASHYGPKFCSFTFGDVSVMPESVPELTRGDVVARHLKNFVRTGLGYRIKLASYKIYPFSDTGAQCWLTWEIEPANDMESWQWTNIYGYRLMPDGKEWWESSVADGEMKELLKRVPDFLASW